MAQIAEQDQPGRPNPDRLQDVAGIELSCLNVQQPILYQEINDGRSPYGQPGIQVEGELPLRNEDGTVQEREARTQRQGCDHDVDGDASAREKLAGYYLHLRWVDAAQEYPVEHPQHQGGGETSRHEHLRRVEHPSQHRAPGEDLASVENVG